MINIPWGRGFYLVSFSDGLLFVVSFIIINLLPFDIFVFFSVPISTKLGTNHPRVKWFLQVKDHSVVKIEKINVFYSYWMSRHNHSFKQMYLLIRTGFSSKQCGPYGPLIFSREQLTVSVYLCLSHKKSCDLISLEQSPTKGVI